MPRGDNPNSKKNLKPFQKGLPEKEQRELQKKGTKASAKKRQQYASFRECFRSEIDDETRKNIYNKIVKMSAAGNLNALKMLLEILGEDAETPTEMARSPVILIPARKELIPPEEDEEEGEDDG